MLNISSKLSHVKYSILLKSEIVAYCLFITKLRREAFT